MSGTEIFTVSMTLLNNILEIWKDERALYYLRKKNKLLKKRLDELAKPIYSNDPTNRLDMSVVDHIERELWLLADLVARETAKAARQDTANRPAKS